MCYKLYSIIIWFWTVSFKEILKWEHIVIFTHIFIISKFPHFNSSEKEKKGNNALAGLPQWTECQPANQRVTGLIPSQSTCPGCRPHPSWGCLSGNHRLSLGVVASLMLPITDLACNPGTCPSLGIELATLWLNQMGWTNPVNLWDEPNDFSCLRFLGAVKSLLIMEILYFPLLIRLGLATCSHTSTDIATVSDSTPPGTNSSYLGTDSFRR